MELKVILGGYLDSLDSSGEKSSVDFRLAGI